MHIVAWNIDGYDDKIHEKLCAVDYDIVFLSETKRKPDYLATKLKELDKYNFIINVHTPCNFHGVVMLIKKGIDYQHINVKLPIACRSDNKSGDPCSGRVITVLINDVYIVGTYVPNSGSKDQVKLDYRVRIWDPALANLLNSFDKVIFLGDINVAPTEKDVSHPAKMKYYAGFSPEERKNIEEFLKGDWVDLWRERNPDKKQFTWVGYPNKLNYGLRLDNIIVKKQLLPLVQDVYIDSTFNLSDHLLVGIKIDLLNNKL